MNNLKVCAKTKLGKFNLDAEFKAAGSQVTVLFGRSGAGKTTIIEAIAGLGKLTSGRISLGGKVFYDSASGINLKPEKRGLGYVFQDARLFPHLTVRRNLLYGRRFSSSLGHVPDYDAVVELLGILEILERFPATLSGGEMQRVAIGRALLRAPDILLMDEPLASLDPSRKNEVIKYIARLKNITSLPIVYVTHSADEVLRLADQVILISDGKVQASGVPAEVMGRPDLEPFVLGGAGGTIVDTIIESQEKTFELTRLAFPGGTLLVPRINSPKGTRIRVRIRSRDVALAISKPESISVLNVLPVRVLSIGLTRGAAVDVVLDAKVPLRAQITAKSLSELNIHVGMEVFALIKTVAVEGREHV